MISIGGIIGAGLFVSSSTSIIAGGPASFISYAICGLLILLIMRMLGEMATALPEVRSFTEFARAGLGEGAGFVVGWLYWYFWVLVVPVEAIAGAKILQLWLPLSPLQIGLGLMTIMTCVNLMSARSYAEFEFWFASIKVAAIIVFIAVAASFAFGWTAPHGATFGNLVDYGGFTPHGWIAVLAAVPTVFFAMTGAEITTIAAAESAHPGRAVARMGSAVIWRILMFYVLSVFLIVAVTPWNTVRSGESPFTLALNTMHVPWAGIDHEHHHFDCRTFLSELGVLCELAGDVHPGGSRRRASGTRQAERTAGAGGFGADGRGRGLSRNHRGDGSPAEGVRFSGQFLRCTDRFRVHDDLRGADPPAHAPRAGRCNRYPQ